MPVKTAHAGIVDADCGVIVSRAKNITTLKGRSRIPMKNTILVLADPNEPQLAVLENLRAEANIITGNSVETFGPAARDATVIFNWSGSLELLRAAFGMCPNVRWVHSRSAGLERTLFPELIERPVPLTNGSGVFSPSLAEFVLGAILFFAKDFRRMIRNQICLLYTSDAADE